MQSDPRGSAPRRLAGLCAAVYLSVWIASLGPGAALARAQASGGPGLDPDTTPAVDPRPEAALVVTGARAGGPTGGGAENEPAANLLAFNTPASRARLLAHEGFDPLYMGIKEHDGHPVELEALRILLEDARVGIACNRIRDALGTAGSSDPGKREDAIGALARWLATEQQRPDFSDRYLSYLGEGGRVDPDFLIYTTPHAAIARFYGEIVLEIHEERPRGVDLNGLNKEVYHFYDNLSLLDRLNPRGIVIRGLFDRDEYVIPSHIPNREVAAVEVRARLAIDPHRAVRLTGHMLRRYARGGDGHARWVDVTDFTGAFLARFTTDPGVGAPAGNRSVAPFPAEVVDGAAALSIGGSPVRVLR